MKVIETKIPEVLIIEPQVFGDQRGFFLETFSAERYRQQAGLTLPFVQDNHSRSAHGVLRGLHLQKTRPQGKLVRVVLGNAFDVAVDVRAGSSTFGQWVGIELSEENHKQFYIPPGFAHGFCALSERVDFEYKCTDYYDPDDEVGLLWDDPDLAIDWPIADPTVSAKDAQNLSFQEYTARHV